MTNCHPRCNLTGEKLIMGLSKGNLCEGAAPCSCNLFKQWSPPTRFFSAPSRLHLPTLLSGDLYAIRPERTPPTKEICVYNARSRVSRLALHNPHLFETLATQKRAAHSGELTKLLASTCHNNVSGPAPLSAWLRGAHFQQRLRSGSSLAERDTHSLNLEWPLAGEPAARLSRPGDKRSAARKGSRKRPLRASQVRPWDKDRGGDCGCVRLVCGRGSRDRRQSSLCR